VSASRRGIEQTAPARLQREVPAATDKLPGRTLTLEGGGKIAADPQDRLGTKAFEKMFPVDIELPPDKNFICVWGPHLRAIRPRYGAPGPALVPGFETALSEEVQCIAAFLLKGP